MRTRLLLLVILLGLLPMRSAADWQQLQLVYLPGIGRPGGNPKAVLETHVNATDGFDGEFQFTPSTGYGAYFAFHKTAGVQGWDGATGWYSEDFRAPLAAGQMSVMDGIYLWAVPGTPKKNLVVELTEVWIPASIHYRLTLVQVPAGIQYSGPREWGISDKLLVLPYYATADGLTGYKFRAEFTAVPEPSSLAALGGGMMGLLALRRRRR